MFLSLFILFGVSPEMAGNTLIYVIIRSLPQKISIESQQFNDIHFALSLGQSDRHMKVWGLEFGVVKAVGGWGQGSRLRVLSLLFPAGEKF